jgi:hypothetical protein
MPFSPRGRHSFGSSSTTVVQRVGCC